LHDSPGLAESDEPYNTEAGDAQASFESVSAMLVYRVAYLDEDGMQAEIDVEAANADHAVELARCNLTAGYLPADAAKWWVIKMRPSSTAARSKP